MAINRWLASNNRLATRLLVLLGVLVASVIVGIIAPRVALGSRLFALLALVLVGIGPALLLISRPAIGLLLLVPAALYVPFSIGTGTGTSLSAPVLLLVFLVALWFMDMLVRQKRIAFISSKAFLPLGLLLAVALLAFAMGQLPWFLYARQASLGAQLGGLAIFFLAAATFALVAHKIPDLPWLRYLTWLFLALGGLLVLGRHVPALGIVPFFQPGANGSLFWIWMVALSFSQAMFNTSLKLHWRLFLAVLAAATLAVILLQRRQWVSGWVPALVAMGVLVWLRSWRWGLLLTVMVVIIVMALNPGLINEMFATDAYSINTRWAAWEIVLRDIVSVNPLLGLGPANYYHYTSLFSIIGWNVAFNSHNQYVDLLAQTGILGLLCFAWFMWEVWRLGWRLRIVTPEGFARAYVYGALAGLVGMLVAGMLGDWVLPFVYNIGLNGFRASMLGWLFLGGLVALERMYATAET